MRPDPPAKPPGRMVDTFTDIYRRNVWGSAESRSGPGSTRTRAADFVDELVALIRELNVRVLLDAGCGDFQWAAPVADAVERYIGVEVVPELVLGHQREHADDGRVFMAADLATDPLPRADLILCRDCLVHLSFADIDRTVRNFRRSGSTYLLTTTFVDRHRNDEIATGDWRPLNFERAPFDWPQPLALIDERCTHTGGIYRD